MKPHHFLSIAATGALSCCGGIHDPIYYNDGKTAVDEATVQSSPPAVQATATTSAQATRPSTPQKSTGLRRSGPFMQPDVFGMPKNDDLKETATSTPNNSSNTGLTVPNP